MKNLRMLFGIKIKKLRQERNFTQEQLAAKAEISVDFLGLVERGINAPSFASIEKLANALSVEIKELFDFDKV